MNFAHAVQAQQVTILDTGSSEPVESVALFNQSKTISTISDLYGKADIHIFRESDSIYFQHPSYETATYTKHELLFGTGTVELIKRIIMMEEFVISAVKGIERLGAKAVVRQAKGKLGPVVTDNGNVIVDADFGAMETPGELEAELIAIPGVLETGLFLDYAHIAYVGTKDSVIEMKRE